MPDSSSARSRRKAAKPSKPHRDFPLFAHARGYWAKKVRGKLHYFGRTAADPKGDAALALWLEQKDALLAGRTPRPKQDTVTLEDVCDAFLTAKDALLESGELAPRTYGEYKATCERLGAELGFSRPVDDLTPADFEKLRANVAKQWGPVRLANEVQRVRSVFKHAFEAALIDRPVRFGPSFRKPSRKTLRKHRAAKAPRMFEAVEAAAIVEAAGVHLRAMVLLGLNCAYGNHDCAMVPLSALDLDRGWIDFPRPKTGIPRRAKLWPETIEALKASLAARPAHKAPADAGLVFITKYGAGWAAHWSHGALSKEFRKLLVKTGLHKPGLGFYTLRHVFRTVADETRDQPAVNAVMGHADESMAAVYRERISDERLGAVAEHVRAWLKGGEK